MNSEKRGERLIFIGGTPRSGTTLLQNMLDCHPEIFAGPEFTYLPHIVTMRNTFLHSADGKNLEVFCNKEDIDDGIASLIERLLLPVADRRGRRFLSEKTPFNVLVFSDLLVLFPAAHFIHVVRDPRAIVASMIQVGVKARNKGIKPPTFSVSLENAIECIEKCVRAGTAAAKACPSRVNTVLFEKLTAEPKAVLLPLCEFLGVEWSDCLLRPAAQSHTGEISLDGVYYDRESYYRDPDPAVTDQWKQRLNPQLIDQITAAFRENNDYKELGYVFSSE
ncbi:MAG: sulfotransferase [Candidatus Omnitrophota bacterium]